MDSVSTAIDRGSQAPGTLGGAEARPGARIGPYELVGRIAQGGMGSIHAARRRAAGGFEKLCAVKLLHPQLLSERRFVDMFLDEARIAALIDHPNVVSTLDVIDHDGAPVIVMELLRGRSLSALLEKGAVERAALYTILGNAAEGLAAAHETVGPDGRPLELVHRDVSPHNIHVGYDGHVKLIDFGVAAARGKISSTRTGEVKGKLAYLAPEQVVQGPIDHRTDLFALGVVAWEALAGERLFRQDEEGATLWAVMHKQVPALDKVASDVPAEVARIVSACLARSIDDRPTSAREVASVFREAARAAAPASSPMSLVAAAMRAMAGEKSEDEARLATLTRSLEHDRPAEAVAAEQGEPSASESTSTVVTGAVLPLETSTPRRRPSLMFAGLVVLATAAALLTFAWRRNPKTEPAPSTSIAVATETVSVTLSVSPEVQLVLVEGARVDSRPLTIALPPAGAVRVSLVGSDGRMEERTVTADDAGRTLALASATASASAPPTAAPVASAPPTPSAVVAPKARPTATATTAAPSAGTPLLRSPY